MSEDSFGDILQENISGNLKMDLTKFSSALQMACLKKKFEDVLKNVIKKKKNSKKICIEGMMNPNPYSYSLVGWGRRIHLLHLYREARPTSTTVLDTTLECIY